MFLSSFTLWHQSTSPQSQPVSPTLCPLLVSQLLSLILGLFSSLSLLVQPNIPRGPHCWICGQDWKKELWGNWRPFNILTFNPKHCHVLPLSLFFCLFKLSRESIHSCPCWVFSLWNDRKMISVFLGLYRWQAGSLLLTLYLYEAV